MKHLLAIFLILCAKAANADILCDKYDQIFQSNFNIVSKSNTEVRLTRKNLNNKMLIISVGEQFNSLIDKHTRTTYQLVAISESGIEVEYTTYFDSRSFGGNKQECNGKIFIKVQS